jgi:hypothetical protein
MHIILRSIFLSAIIACGSSLAASSRLLSSGETVPGINLGFDTTFILGQPLNNFRQQYPQAPCYSTKSIIYCKFDIVPAEICPLARCESGKIFFEEKRVSGFSLISEPMQWIFLRDQLSKIWAKPTSSIDTFQGRRRYFYDWKTKYGELTFAQLISSTDKKAPDYLITFRGQVHA